MKNLLCKNLSNPIAVSSCIFLVSTLCLSAALTAQYVFGLEPCPLCMYQRWPYVIGILMGIVGLGCLISEDGQRLAAIASIIAAIAFTAGGIIAFYHVGVEQHWWKSALEGCAVSFEESGTDDIMALFDNKPAARCDEIAWVDPVLGQSMAVYNTLTSFAMALYSLTAALFIFKTAPKKDLQDIE